MKRDDAIRAALPILQRSQAGQTSYTLKDDPKLEDALMENTPSGLASFALISMHITRFRLEIALLANQPTYFSFGPLSRRALAGA